MLGLTDAYCVRYLQTFQAMPWRYKMLDISSEIAPLVATFIAWAGRHDGGWNSLWVGIAILFWLGFALTISNYIRGYLALKRGVQPAPRETKPGFRPSRVMMILFGAGTILLFGLPLVNSFRHGFQDVGSRDQSAGIFLILFTQQLSAYARNRSWDDAPEQISIASM